ncbi:hypothetical protein K2P97_06810 [bacterium]|nr:hypothetical protein [bacterium]
MNIEKLDESLKFDIDYFLSNPTEMIDSQIDFWIRQPKDKKSKSFTNKEINEIISLATELKLRYQNYIENKKFYDLTQEIELVTIFFKEKIVKYAKLKNKVHVRNAFLNLNTIFSNSYEIQYILSKLDSCIENEAYLLFFKFGKLISELDFVTGQAVNSKEKALLAQQTKEKQKLEFYSLLRHFLSLVNQKFTTNTELFNYLTDNMIQFNKFLKTKSLSYSAECDENKEYLILKFGKNEITIEHPVINSNSHTQIKKIFNYF